VSGAAIWNKSPRLVYPNGKAAKPVQPFTALLMPGERARPVLLEKSSAAGLGP